jgi:hypothetical protein
MLNLKKISALTPYSDEWWIARNGMMTGSKISCICGERGIGDGGMTYIRSKVGEKISGKSSERNITNEGVVWGIDNEPKSIEYYGIKYNIPVMVINKHLVYDDLYSVTPDALIIHKELGNSYDCETLETKSYITYATHIEHCECETPKDIKLINKPLYWQVISQMHFADVLVGNAVFFHPDFNESTRLRQHRVQFKKIDLIPDFKLLDERMKQGRDIYEKLFNKFKSKTT